MALSAPLSTTLSTPFLPSDAGAAAFNPITDIAWHAAYWTGGPEFAALGLADGAAVATFPDEKGARDLTQATAGKRPTLRAASTGMGGQPVLEFDGTDDFVQCATALFGTLPQPNEIVIVGRYRTISASGSYLIAGDVPGSATNSIRMSTAGQWRLTAGISLVGSAADTTKRVLDAQFNGASSSLTADGTSVVSGDAGAFSLAGFSIGTDTAVGIPAPADIAFVGVSDTLLTAQNRTDLRTWASGLYGTT